MDFYHAIETIKDNIHSLRETTTINTINALNHVLAKDIISDVNVPHYRTSMRDGYAVKYTDQNKYHIVGDIHAGEVFEFDDMNYRYIATGGILPDNTDTVIMIEDVEFNNQKTVINVKKGVKVVKGQWIREIGSDIRKDLTVIKQGEIIDECSIATLISIGVKKINILRQPAIGILSSGDEIVDYNKDKLDHQVYDSNRPMILSYLKDFKVLDYGIVSDDYKKTKEKIEYILREVDLLITSGGISMGKKDFIKPILKEMGEILIEKVVMKPGKPLIFSKIKEKEKDKYVFSLPGNPVASGVTFLLFVKPSINVLKGLDWALPPKMSAYLRGTIIPDKSRLEFMRGRLYYSKKYNRFFVETNTDNLNSSNISSMMHCNCLIEVPVSNKLLKGGSLVSVYSLGQPYENTEILNIGVLTASDRASAGIYEDKSGDEIQKYVTENVASKFNINYALLSDEQHLIKNSLKKLADNMCCNLILTTGGTGPSLRDVTDKATIEVCHKLLPGFGEIIRQQNFSKVPTSILSAQTAGIRYIKDDIGCLIINLPGKPSAIRECLDIVFKSIPKCMEIINADEFILR